MDRYEKVKSQRNDVAEINENEIRITTQGLVRNYISYASTLLYETKGKEIVFKAMGQAISKAVSIAEIMKRKLPHLHQDTVISSVSITDVWEPIEEGLVRVEQTRHVSVISITLSPNVLDRSSPGYQAPALQHQEKPPRQGRVIYNAANQVSYDRGRGGGRGRGGYRDGYDNYQENDGYSNRNRGGYRDGYDNYQENDGYSNRNRGGGHGRSWDNRGYGYEGGNGYNRGDGYNRNDGYNRGSKYNNGDGYYRRGGNERSNGYERDNGYERRNRFERGDRYERENRYERDDGNRRGYAGNDRGGRNYERDDGFVQQRGRGGRRGGYGRGAGRMGGGGPGGRGRDGGY